MSFGIMQQNWFEFKAHRVNNYLVTCELNHQVKQNKDTQSITGTRPINQDGNLFFSVFLSFPSFFFLGGGGGRDPRFNYI